MIDPNVKFGLVNIGTAILIMALSIPLVLRKVKMNGIYGVRIPKSFSSDANWYEINAYGGRQLIRRSVLPLLTGIACFFLPANSVNQELAPLLLGVAPMMLVVLMALVRILRFARAL
jgi:hypothetical protein